MINLFIERNGGDGGEKQEPVYFVEESCKNLKDMTWCDTIGYNMIISDPLLIVIRI